jgi:DNA-binding transcriptional LysR family regulator
MNVSDMDWDLCRYFAAVAETGDFAGAARRLRSSHPTVSRKIRALERALGARLFVRTIEGLSLTAQGRRFREHATAMEAAALKAEAAVSARGAAARGVVKLSIGPTLASHWLMPRVGPFLETHRHIELDLITHPFPVSVKRREADIVLRLSDPGEENLVGRRIGRLGVGFYASRGYAARRPLPEHRDDWRHHHVIGFADKATNTELGRWSDRVAREASTVMRCSSQSDMLAATRAGVGISVMSRFVGDSFPDLVRVAPQKLAGLSDMWLLAHPDLSGAPAVREVLNFITGCARDDREKLRG